MLLFVEFPISVPFDNAIIGSFIFIVLSQRLQVRIHQFVRIDYVTGVTGSKDFKAFLTNYNRKLAKSKQMFS